MSKKTGNIGTMDSNAKAAAARKKKLGKGLGALLGETKREEPLVQAAGAGSTPSTTPSSSSAVDSPLKSLSIASIEPLPGNPRKHFDDSAVSYTHLTLPTTSRV